MHYVISKIKNEYFEFGIFYYFRLKDLWFHGWRDEKKPYKNIEFISCFSDS